ncbi:putative nucleotide-binding protein [Clostridium beijerinckii]|uniref:nucleotide-binding protein n=1 Tax=Clostridium beijerinckii TaxID=1520 RepID=UPI001494E789|nr:nucleotide-binding protein [Clostridium beijerinckii]NOW92380.1 putative nucleotide-binding protein [Clostridium beijerinckii]
MSISNKPKVFIGSSVESLKIAEAIQVNLQYLCHSTNWTQGIFKPSKTALDNLVNSLENFDFAIFVFSPDDITEIKKETHNTIRDNVIFETGLFIGRLGRDRVFYIAPEDIEIHFPSDLIGFFPEKYDINHPNLIASVGTACMPIKEQIESLGRLT